MNKEMENSHAQLERANLRFRRFATRECALSTGTAGTLLREKTARACPGSAEFQLFVNFLLLNFHNAVIPRWRTVRAYSEGVCLSRESSLQLVTCQLKTVKLHQVKHCLLTK